MTGHRIPHPLARYGERLHARGSKAMQEMRCSCDPMQARRAVTPVSPVAPTPLYHSRPTPSGPLLFLPLRERGVTVVTSKRIGLGDSKIPDSALPPWALRGGNGGIRLRSARARSRSSDPTKPRAPEPGFSPFHPYRSSTRARAYRTFDIGREGANVGCSIHSLRLSPRLLEPLGRFLPDVGRLARWRWLEGLTRPFSALPFGCDNARMFGSEWQTGRSAPSVGFGRSVRVMRGWSEKSQILGPRYPSARLSALASHVSSVFVWSAYP